MKNKLVYFFICLVSLVAIGAIIYFVDKKDIFPQELIFNKTTPTNIKLKYQETVAIFREVDGKEIKMESFFDIGLGCASLPEVGPPTAINIYPTNDKLYTGGGYQSRSSELNACMKGKIIQFKIQTPYNPEKDVYYLVIKQKGEIKLKVKLPPISSEINLKEPEIDLMEEPEKISIKIYNPSDEIDEIFDYHPAFGDFQAEIFKIINYADIFYTINPEIPANNIEDVKKSDYQELAKNLIENTKKKTVVIELNLDKTQELVLDHFSPPLKIGVQKIILQKDLIAGYNLLGYGICALAENNLIYCVSNKSGLTGNRVEINKIIRMLEILD